MLRLPWIAARRHCLRSYSSATSTPSDLLDEVLKPLEDSSSSASEEGVPDTPPVGPPGVLHQPPPSSSRGAHVLPSTKDLRIYHLHVFASHNNTILTLTNAVRNPIKWVSAGSCGFKHVHRSGYEAGYQCAVKMFEIVAEERDKNHMTMKLEILFNGFGNGREAFYRALMTTEGERVRPAVFKLTDTTPLKVGGGTRAKKARRM